MITTTLYDLEFTNLGPLTTTFTLPRSCMTLTDRQVAPTDTPYIPHYHETCALDRPPLGACFPSGSAIDERIRGEPRPDRRYAFLAYHSPGNICPSGWTTAGAAAKDDAGSVTSAGGVFTATEFPGPEGTPVTEPQAVPFVHIVSEGIEAGETGILCCPSGFSASPYGGCVKNYAVELYTATTGCMVFVPWDGTVQNYSITYNGEVLTGQEYRITATEMDETTSSEVTTFSEGEMTGWIGVTNVPMVVLVDTGEGEGKQEKPTETGNAAAGGPRGGSVGWMAVAGIWGVAMLAGAGVFAGL
jgi:hypothetical protein